MIQSLRANSKGTQILKTIMNHEDISCVLIDDNSQSAFVGSLNWLNQIDLRSQKVMNYSDLKIRKIKSLTSIHNRLFVKSYNYTFSLINITKRRILTIDSIKTRISLISTSQFTIINWNNNPTATLTIAGGKSIILIIK